MGDEVNQTSKDGVDEVEQVSDVNPLQQTLQLVRKQFLELHDSLVETEDRIRFARQFYNDVVMRYNTLINTAPDLLAAKSLGFSERPFFSDKA